MRIPLSLAITLAVLSGCGEPEKEPEKDPPQTDPIDYSNLESTIPTREALILADEATLDRHIKNGLRLAMASAYLGGGGGSAGGDSSSSGGAPPSTPSPEPTPVPGTPTPPTDGGDPESGGEVPYSDTNVHVAGVDESDFAKYDGTHWYVATSTARTTDLTVSGSPGFQIVAPDPTVPTAEILSQYKLDDQWGNVGEMYLLGDGGSTSQVVLLRGRYGNVPVSLPMPMQGGVGGAPPPTPAPEPTPEPTPVASSSAPVAIAAAAMPGWFEPSNGKVRIQLIDVEDSYAPAEAWDIQLDGTLIDSRKIGDVLYLVTRFEPWVHGLSYQGGDATERQENEKMLTDQPLSELLPQFQVDDGAPQPLTTDCYVQQDLPENGGFSSLVHITAIDLRQQSLLSSRCLNTAISAISMSQESLYLTGNVVDPTTWRSEDTVIHKFSLDEDSGLSYAASGFVNGSIHGRSDPAFRLHEHEGDLRVVTTRQSNGPEHQLFILRPAGQNLETVASLPNSNRPEPLGKPNEDIFSVRFEANRAFIVTFQRTDPLYAIDLSDPLDPKVAGELEIPGFATYMHPLNERYLFTLGREATETGATLGIKAELIDLSGGDPVSVDSVVFGDSQRSRSEALHNLRALNFLQVDDDTWRVAFPYEHYTYEYAEASQDRQPIYVNGLQLLEITGLNGDEAQLVDAGLIEAENGEGSYSSFVSRGLLQGDAAFYAHKNAVWAAAWGAANEAEGPITAAPPVCTANIVNGIELMLELETDDQHDACEATVTINDGTYEEILEPLASQSADQSCTFVGAEERAGNYTLTAELPGFQSQNRHVTVWQDECHVITTHQGMTLRDCAVISQAGLVVLVYIPDEAQCEDGVASVVQEGEVIPLIFSGGGGIGNSSGNVQTVCYFNADYLGDYESLTVDFEGYELYEEDGATFTDSTCTSNMVQRRVNLTPL